MFSKSDLLKIILPMIAQQVLEITVTTADSIMVANAGEAAVSGVSLVGTLDTLLIITFSSLVSGGAVIISHVLGENKERAAREYAKQLIYVSSGIALFITIVMSIFCIPLISLLYGSAEKEVLFSANSYFRILILSYPFLAISSSCGAIFRVMGNTIISMKLSFITNIINIVGNALFIFIFHMGAAGAALATMISRIVLSAVLILLLHNRKNAVFIENLFSYRPDFNVIKKILRIGVPHGIENSMVQFGRLLTQMLTSSMGTASIAASSVANVLANYMYMPSGSIQNAAITIVGRCVGAGETKQAKKYGKTLLLWDYFSMWAVSLILFILAKPIIGIYNLSAESTRLALHLTIFHAVCTSLIRPPAFIFPSVFKAAGDVKYSLIVSTISMWCIRVCLAYILSLENITVFSVMIPGAGFGIFGIWIAMVADWVLRAVLFFMHFIKGKWLPQLGSGSSPSRY